MHMLAQCSFTRQLCRSQPENYYAHASPMLVHKANMGTTSKLDRDHIAVTTTTDLLPPSKGWWHNSLQTGANAVSEIEQKFIYTVWNVWKERCRRINDNKALNQAQLVTVIKFDVSQYIKFYEGCASSNA
jgi:hypothetical protein